MFDNGSRRERIRPAFLCWEATPDLVADQLTHAAAAGRSVALCGAHVGAQGGSWPTTLPVGRLWCGACTVEVYGPDGASR